MCIYDYSGDYKANLKEDWIDFVSSVEQAMKAVPDDGFSDWAYAQKIAKHVGAIDQADVQRAIHQIKSR